MFWDWCEWLLLWVGRLRKFVGALSMLGTVIVFVVALFSKSCRKYAARVPCCRKLVAVQRWIEKWRLRPGQVCTPLQQVSSDGCFLLLFVEHPSPFRIVGAQLRPVGQSACELVYTSAMGGIQTAAFGPVRFELDELIDEMQTDGRLIHPEPSAFADTEPWIVFKLVRCRRRT